MSINWSDVTTVGDFANLPNQNVGENMFWTAMLWMIYAILMISMLPMGFESAVLGASFACLMIGIIMVYLGIASWTWVVMFAGIIIAMFIWIMYSQR